MEALIIQVCFCLSYLACHSGVCLSVSSARPESALVQHHYQVITIPKNLSCRSPQLKKRRLLHSIIQGDNPVYSVFWKVSWGELHRPWGWWDGSGSGRELEGRKCRVSLVVRAFLTGLCSHKKDTRTVSAQPIIDPTFWIFWSLFFSLSLFFTAAPIWSVALKDEARLLGRPPPLSGLCHCDSRSGAALGWWWRWWWWAGPRWLQAATHLWRKVVFKLEKWLQNTSACSSV